MCRTKTIINSGTFYFTITYWLCDFVVYERMSCELKCVRNTLVNMQVVREAIEKNVLHILYEIEDVNNNVVELLQ